MPKSQKRWTKFETRSSEILVKPRYPAHSKIFHSQTFFHWKLWWKISQTLFHYRTYTPLLFSNHFSIEAVVKPNHRQHRIRRKVQSPPWSTTTTSREAQSPPCNPIITTTASAVKLHPRHYLETQTQIILLTTVELNPSPSFSPLRDPLISHRRLGPSNLTIVVKLYSVVVSALCLNKSGSFFLLPCERAVQAKVRDFQKEKQKKSMTTRAYQLRNTLRRFTNGDFFQIFC